jgi:hypothetical protein
MDMLLNEDHALLFRSRSIIRLISEQKEISHCSARSLFIPNPFKDVHALRSEKRKAGKRKESRSALPKAKEKLINRIWHPTWFKTHSLGRIWQNEQLSGHKWHLGSLSRSWHHRRSRDRQCWHHLRRSLALAR